MYLDVRGDSARCEDMNIAAECAQGDLCCVFELGWTGSEGRSELKLGWGRTWRVKLCVQMENKAAVLCFRHDGACGQVEVNAQWRLEKLKIRGESESIYLRHTSVVQQRHGLTRNKCRRRKKTLPFNLAVVCLLRQNEASLSPRPSLPSPSETHFDTFRQYRARLQ